MSKRRSEAELRRQARIRVRQSHPDHPQGQPARRRTRRGDRWYRSLPFAVLAGFGIVFACFQSYDLYALSTRGVVVPGTVVAFTGNAKHTSVLIEFTTAEGQTVRASTSHYTSYGKGDRVRVEYDPKDPYRMQDADWGSNSLSRYWQVTAFWLGSVVLLGIAWRLSTGRSQ